MSVCRFCDTEIGYNGPMDDMIEVNGRLEVVHKICLRDAHIDSLEDENKELKSRAKGLMNEKISKLESAWEDAELRAEKAEKERDELKAENKSMQDFLTEINLDWNYASWLQRKETEQ